MFVMIGYDGHGRPNAAMPRTARSGGKEADTLKKIVVMISCMCLFLILMWLGLSNAVEEKEGYHFINPTFAMLNKSLFLHVGEYTKEKDIGNTIKIAKENGIRNVYLELTYDTEVRDILKATELFDRYGIVIGFWYNHQRATTSSHDDIFQQLEQLQKKIGVNQIPLYFVYKVDNQELITYKSTYLYSLLQLTYDLQQYANTAAFGMDIGWIIPSVPEAETINVVYGGYAKKFHFHILDHVDMLALLPSANTDFFSQNLNETVYGERKNKHVHLAIDYNIYKQLRNEVGDVATKLQREYQEMVAINRQSQIVFLDQRILQDMINQRYDLYEDGKIDIRDLSVFLRDYVNGSTSLKHDFNQNGTVDMYDGISLFLNMSGD